MIIYMNVYAHDPGGAGGHTEEGLHGWTEFEDRFETV